MESTNQQRESQNDYEKNFTSYSRNPFSSVSLKDLAVDAPPAASSTKLSLEAKCSMSKIALSSFTISPSYSSQHISNTCRNNNILMPPPEVCPDWFSWNFSFLSQERKKKNVGTPQLLCKKSCQIVNAVTKSIDQSVSRNYNLVLTHKKYRSSFKV